MRSLLVPVQRYICPSVKTMKQAIPINLPNILTLLRILLTPLFAICLIRHALGSALFVFTIAVVTDSLDGLIARLLKQKTTIGAYLDPAADKLLLSTAFVMLAIHRLLPGWLTVIVITRDLLILFGVGLFNIVNAKFEVRPSVLSKITTVAQVLCVCWVLVRVQVPSLPTIEWLLFWFAAGMTTVSGFQYIYRGMNILSEQSSKMP